MATVATLAVQQLAAVDQCELTATVRCSCSCVNSGECGREMDKMNRHHQRSCAPLAVGVDGARTQQTRYRFLPQCPEQVAIRRWAELGRETIIVWLSHDNSRKHYIMRHLAVGRVGDEQKTISR